MSYPTIIPDRTRWRRWTATLFLVGTVASNSAAQSGVLTGRVVDDGTDRPIAGVEISIPATSRSAMSDSLGGFAIDSIPVGRYLVVLRKLGHRPFSTMVTFTKGESPEYVWAMATASPTLAKVEVTANVRDSRPVAATTPFSTCPRSRSATARAVLRLACVALR